MKAMILAAGRGERLQPLTLKKPKPLVHACGKPLIEYQIERLIAAGIDQFVVNVAYLKEQLIEFLGDGRRWGCSIEISKEDEPLETAGGLLNALPLLGDAPFIVVNSDIWVETPFSPLLETESSILKSQQMPQPNLYELSKFQLEMPQHSLFHLFMVDPPSHAPNGDFSIWFDDQEAQRGLLLPDDHCLQIQTLRKTYCGISLFSPRAFEPFKSCHTLALKPVLDYWIERGLATASLLPGSWVDIGTVERLAEVEQMIKESKLK